MAHNQSVELPPLPRAPPSGAIPASQFTRKRLKVLLHQITGELKSRGTKTPHIFLPFRSRIDDSKLDSFLRKCFPDGEVAGENDIIAAVRKADEFTLICALKYLWCRLPNAEVIGWDVYLEYRRKEKDAGYPKDAFLTIMPKCLSSPAHASIVYDFLDLLIGIASNSQYNYLSGRKIAKMSSLWAFNAPSSAAASESAFYDATVTREYNFIQGLEVWKTTSDALFHLLLSFLRAMLPDNDMDTLKLPKTLQSLLITNSYPPAMTDSIKSMITIPCVLIKSTKVSSNPYELISKVRHTLSFEKKNSFLSIENYTILKNIFQKGSTSEIISTLTEESRRVLTRITKDPIQSKYQLYPGWTSQVPETDPDIPLYSQITIHDVTLQDYYIWTWLSTLGSDQTSRMKSLFGRSLVVEAGLKGFQKWLIISEETMTTDEYLSIFKTKPPKEEPRQQQQQVQDKNDSRRQPSRSRVSKKYIQSKEVPPLPDTAPAIPQPKTQSMSPELEAVRMAIEDYDFMSENEDISSDYKTYLQSLSDFNEDDVASSVENKSYFSRQSPSATTQRPQNASSSSVDDKPSAPVVSNGGKLSPPKSRPVKDTSSRDYPHKQATPYNDLYEDFNEPQKSHKPQRLPSEPFERYQIDPPKPREDTRRPIKPVEEIRELMERDVEEQQQQLTEQQLLQEQRQLHEQRHLHEQRQRQSPSRRPPPQGIAQNDHYDNNQHKQWRRPPDLAPPPQQASPFPTSKPGSPQLQPQPRQKQQSPDTHMDLFSHAQKRSSFIEMAPQKSDERRPHRRPAPNGLGEYEQMYPSGQAPMANDLKARHRAVVEKDELPPLPEKPRHHRPPPQDYDPNRPPTPPEKPHDEPQPESKRPTQVPYVEKIPAPVLSPPRQPQQRTGSPKDSQAKQAGGYRQVTPISGKNAHPPKPIRAPQPKKPSTANYQAFAKPQVAPMAIPQPKSKSSAAAGSHPYGTPPKGQQFTYGFGGMPQYYYGQQPGYPPQMGHPMQMGMPGMPGMPGMSMPQGMPGMPRGYAPPYGYPQGMMPQQRYYMPPHGHHPGSHHHAAAQVAQAYNQPPQGYGEPVAPPPQQQQRQHPSSHDAMMAQLPQAGKHNKNQAADKAQIRAALNDMA
ncbi:hypothetical protein DIURU_000821 [Diutina rugosa]|uniref:Meiotically up-regulated protein Msb1/Mug8 domain-containing protein n=1 Tax=Diutina rugosa TaxID=5481 RepID=A0A642UX37_DIURU|nr:uncharacterized protein DIURU_000821 [Diutina rugosa]KAA8907137.1 hypothetical protein DIURU_000821 [Diutina rugosa]